MFDLFLVICYCQDQKNTLDNQNNIRKFYKGSIESLTITLDTKKQNLTSKNIQPLSKNLSQIKSIFGDDIFSMSMKGEDKIELSSDGHPVFNGYVQAFQDHRPITISPDIFWLLIVQGFSYHIAKNHEKLRSKFVNFSNQKELTVNVTAPTIESIQPDEWQNLFSQFVCQITYFTGSKIIETLTPNFTTTTPISLAAGQISIMSAMKYYFKYRVIVCVCGFPYITVEGTLEDWIKIEKKIENLKNYEIDDWIESLIPIINKIIELKRDNIVDKEFWNSMIHKHDGNGIYDPSFFDGWFSNLFPYDFYGDRLHGKIVSITELPSEILAVPFLLEVRNDMSIKGTEIRSEFLTGFVGITQDNETSSIKPEIGWVIRREKLMTPQHPIFDY